MARSVYKICSCRDQVKCRHPWWFSYKRADAGRIRKSLDVVLEKHVDSKTVAEREAERLRIGLVDNTLPPRLRQLLGLPASPTPFLPTLTIRQLLATYQERHLDRMATKDNAAYQVGTITRTVLPRPDGTTAALGDWLVLDVTADTLERFREARLVSGIQTTATGTRRIGGTIAANRDLRLLRAAFNWAIRTKQVKDSPFKIGTEATVTLMPEAARSRRLQADEAERLLAQCGTHLRAVVEAALETGCRRGELLGLQWRDVDLQRRTVTLPAAKTKTGKARTVPVSTRLQAILEMRRLDPDGQVLGPDRFVFGNEIGQRTASIKTAWRLTCQRAKIEDLHVHDLRREAGSRWMDAGVPLGTIQRWLGHTNVAQTSTYLSTTAAGEHEAMRRFDERRGCLTRVDTDGGTPPLYQAQSESESNESARSSTVRH